MSKHLKIVGVLAGGILALVSMGPAADFHQRLSLRISGGMGYLGLGEFGEYFSDRNDYLTDAAPLHDNQFIGELRSPRWGFDGTAEMVLKLSNRFGLGLGVGFLQTRRESGFELQWVGTGALYEKEDWNVRLSAVPLSLNGYYFLPLSARLSAFFKGGLSSYLARLAAERYFVNSVRAEMINFELEDRHWGVQGGAGILYRLSSRIGLLIEATARSVRFENWCGKAWNVLTPDLTESGSLWTVEILRPDTQKVYKTIEFSEHEPEADEGVQNTHRSAINFSGFSLRVGLEIRFGK